VFRVRIRPITPRKSIRKPAAVAAAAVSDIRQRKPLFMSEKLFRETLEPYLPSGTAHIIAKWIEDLELRIVLWNHRKTKYGDFRPARSRGERNAISINTSLNPYSFLLTIVHELAHAAVYAKYGRTVKPHGEEWKQEYRTGMLVFIGRNIFPDALEREVAAHLKNPKASANADVALEKQLKKYDDKPDDGLVYIDDLQKGDTFFLPSKGVFIKGDKRRTRHHCTEKSTGRKFLISGIARVKKMK